MGKLGNMVMSLFEKKQSKPAAETIYAQEPGSLVTLEAEVVDVAVSNDNRQIEVRPAAEPRNLATQGGVRKMGGEEIRPGTLH